VVVRNTTGYTITNGKAVRATMASGYYSGAALASCTDEWDSVLGVIGLATQDITNNTTGKITLIGNVNDINTTAFAEGSNLWLSTTAGELTMTRPEARGCKQVRIGTCLRSNANVGRIGVAVRIVPRPSDIGAPWSEDTGAAFASQTNVNTAVSSGMGTLTSAVNAVASTTATHTAQIAALAVTQAVVTASLPNYMPLAGGTFTGAVYTTITNAPAENELVRAGWVRSLIMAGSEWYYTTNVATGYGAKSANFVSLSTVLPSQGFTNSIASPVPSSTYIAGGVITGTVASFQSPITIDVWASRVGGSGSSVIPLLAEIYYVYAGTTNHLGDWSVGPMYVTQTTPENLRFVVSFNAPAVTGAVQIIGYLKTGTVSGPAAGLRIYGGAGYSSHMDIEGTSGVLAGDVDAKLTTHTNRTDNPHSVTASQVGAVATNDARYLAALTNVPTLQAVVNAGNTATGIGDLTIAGRVVHGSGLDVANIAANAAGARQDGFNGGTMTIGNNAIGSRQYGYNSGTMTIATDAQGAQQAGRNAGGTMAIGSLSMGAMQRLFVASSGFERAIIGNMCYGASQFGYVFQAYATNDAIGAMQLLNLSAGQSATITADGSASLGLGACVVSNKQSIVAGDGQQSHGAGSVTAGGGFWVNDTPVVTNYAATPFDAAVTIDNTSPLSVTSYFGHAYSRTFTSTGTITHVFLGNAATSGNEIYMETTATGLPARVWPAGYVFGYAGAISSNAPSPSPWAQMSVQKTPMGSIVWCVTGQVWQAGTP
jgi:hypothetical protein